MAGFEESDLYAAFGLEQPAGGNEPGAAEPGAQEGQARGTEPGTGEAQEPAQTQEQDPSRDQGDGGPRAAPAVPGTFPERPRQRAGRKESPPSRPRSSPRKGDAASVMRQSLKRLPSGRRMQPAGGGKSSRPPLTPP